MRARPAAAGASSAPRVGFQTRLWPLTCGFSLGCPLVFADQPAKDRSAPDSLPVETRSGMIGCDGRSWSARRPGARGERRCDARDRGEERHLLTAVIAAIDVAVLGSPV